VVAQGRFSLQGIALIRMMSLPMTPAFLIRSLGVLQSCLTVGLLGIVMLFYISCSSRNNATNHSCEEVALTGRECKDSNLSLLRSQTLDVAVPQSLEIRAIPARVSQPPTSDHRVMRASHQPKPPELEDWMANQLGSGVKVRLGRAGKLLITRSLQKNEQIPLFEEAIILGKLRALVRAADPLKSGEVEFRAGVATVAINAPLQSDRALRVILKILDIPEVSEVRIQSFSDLE
jgi:hypothetical protein